MPDVLQLINPVGRGQRNNEDDVEALDDSLRNIGAYDPPAEYSAGPQRYITEPVVDALEQFQEQNGLKVDGYAEPGGETERAINNRVLKKPRGAGLLHDFDMTLDDTVGSGFRNGERDVKTVKRALGGLGYMPEDPFDDPSGFIDERSDSAVRAFQEKIGLRVDGWMRPGGETETALQDAVETLKTNLRPAWEAYERRVPGLEATAEPAQYVPSRPGLTFPPLVPPTEAPGGDWAFPKITLPPRKFLPRWSPPAPRPENDVPPEYISFHDVTRTIEPTLLDDLIVPRRGNEDTQDQNDRLGLEFTKIATRFGCDFDHIGGARQDFKKSGERVKEKEIRAQPDRLDGTGRRVTRDSAYGDVHLKTKVGKHTRHAVLQTVDTYASGAPTARELQNAIKILRNGGKNFYVLLVPKLPKGMSFDMNVFDALVRQMLDKVCNEDEREDSETDRQHEHKEPPKR